MNSKQRKQMEDTLAKCRNLMRLQHKAWATEQSYLSVIGSYIRWVILHGSGLPDSKSRIEGYLTHEALRWISATTQNVAFHALLYLYSQVRGENIEGIQALRAKRPARARTSLPRAVTLDLLQGVPDVGGYPTRLIAHLLYGMGLRVSEPLNLRIKDIDVIGSRLTIRDGKGGKDRTLRVPCSLMGEMVQQIKKAKEVWQMDQERNLPVEIPGRLGIKYKKAAYSWQWAWVFPGHRPCPHPRTGEMVRYHMHECNVQRAVRISATRLGIESQATPHVLRHCYATHVLEAGANVRDLQEQMGHAHLDTTMIYAHGNSERVRSPLEVLA